MSRAVPIAEQSEGINLLRSKGGASPGALFDLVNGYVTPKRTIAVRQGTVTAARFAANTFGVVGFEGKFHTFTAYGGVTTIDSRVVVHVLRRSDNSSANLKRIHKAFPFLGRLYVVAEYTDGVIRHFYLEAPTVWKPNTVYQYGQKVSPSVENGYYYVIEAVDAAPAWQAGVAVALNDIKQPTTPNGFKYKATALAGASGTTTYLTSDTEPTWPTTDGATVTERRYITNPHVFPGSGQAGTPRGAETDTAGEYGPFPPTSGGATREPSSGSA